jgi:hypothetical protein
MVEITGDTLREQIRLRPPSLNSSPAAAARREKSCQLFATWSEAALLNVTQGILCCETTVPPIRFPAFEYSSTLSKKAVKKIG